MLAELAYYYHWSCADVEEMSQNKMVLYHQELIRIFNAEKEAIEKERNKAKNNS